MLDIFVKGGYEVTVYPTQRYHDALAKMKSYEEEYDLEAGTWVFVPSEASHSFWNTSETEDLVSLCTVTVEGDTDPLALTRGC